MQQQVDAYAELAQLRAQVQMMALAMEARQSPAPSAPRPPKIRQPSSYSGSGGNAADDWIVEMEQQFVYYGASTFPNDSARIKFATAYLAGPALLWWQKVPTSEHPNTWQEFVDLLRERYRPVQAAMLARQTLGHLRMKPQHSVNQFTSAFQRTLTPITDMSDADQVHLYMQGLQSHIAQKVWGYHPTNLREAINHAVSVEAMANFGRAAMPQRSGFGHKHGGYNPSPSSSTSVPMDINSIESFLVEPEVSPPPSDSMAPLLAQIGEMQQCINALQHASKSSKPHRGSNRVSGLKPGEIAQLMAEGKCFLCKQAGHMKGDCPQRNKPKNA